MSGIDNTFDSLKDLLLKEQFLNVCTPELRIALKEKYEGSTMALAKKADLYEEARKYDSSWNKPVNTPRNSSNKQEKAI